MDANFFEHIRQTLLKHPKQVFVVWPAGQGMGSTTYTGEVILSRVQTIRKALTARLVKPGEQVLLAVPVSMDLISSLLAVMALGAIPVLPPVGISPKRLLRLMRLAKIRAVVTQRPPKLAFRLVARALGVRLIAVGSLKNEVEASTSAAPVAAGQTALVSHSSGSTGQPKRIRRSHQVLRAQHEAIKAVFPPWTGQRDFPLFPNILLHNLTAGVVSILPDMPWNRAAGFSAARIIEQLAQEQVQTLTGNVFYFNRLLQHLRQHSTELPEVIGIGIGGSPIPEPLVKELPRYFPNAVVHIIYGSSEAEPIAVRKVTATPINPLAGYCVGSLHPTLECQLRPLGELRRGPAGSQLVGEIQVRGAHVATAEPGQWLSTGDYGYFADGQLFLTGRQGNERLHQGVQHYQIEHLLYHLPGVERVAARADSNGFTVFVQGPANASAVEELLAKNFPDSLCNAILFRPLLPVDPRHHSKILYDQLR